MTPQLLRLVGSVVAPTTLLTGLMVYFGQTYVAGYCRYFGVNFTALDLSVQDYLIRSIDAVFVPLTCAAAVALLAFWANRVITRMVRRREGRTVWLIAGPIAVAGAILLALALTGLVSDDTFVADIPELGGLGLATGVLLLSYAAGLLAQWREQPVAGTGAQWSPARWGAEFLLISIGLFWAVGSYANGVGIGRADQMQQNLSSWPDAVLYSSARLNLTGPGVSETACRDSHSAYPFRVSGLKMVLQSGNQYFLLPAGWTASSGAAVLLPRSDSVRLEFTKPAFRPTAGC